MKSEVHDLMGALHPGHVRGGVWGGLVIMPGLLCRQGGHLYLPRPGRVRYVNGGSVVALWQPQVL